MRALIVDAQSETRSAIELALAPRRLEFIECADPARALELARTPNLGIIFLRVELPTSSGFMICNKLRRDEQTRRIPLIMYSSSVDDDMLVQHAKLKTRADEYVRIPAAPDVWRNAIRKLLPQR
jgi:CheY-like chemotaxis protein